MADPYQAQLEAGGKQVVRRLEAMARDRGLDVQEVFWGRGELVANRVSQTLVTRGDGKNAHAVFEEKLLLDPDSPPSRDTIRETLEDLLQRYEAS